MLIAIGAQPPVTSTPISLAFGESREVLGAAVPVAPMHLYDWARRWLAH